MSHPRAITRWPLRLLGAVAVTSLLLTGCSDRTGNSNDTEGTKGAATSALLTEPTELPVTESLSKKPEEGLTVAYLYSGLDQSAAFLRGIKAGAAALKWNLKEFTFDPTNPATLLSAATSALAAKPALLITNTLPGVAVEQIYAATSKANIPMIDMGTSTPAKPGRYPMLTATTNVTHAAQMAAQQLVTDAKADNKVAKVLEVTVPQFADVLGPLSVEVKKALADCDGCTHDVLDVSLADVLGGKGTQQIVSYLQAHPDVNYVFADGAQIDLGLPAALQAAGLTDVQRYGALPGAAQLGELRSGAPGAWATFPLETYGWAMVDNAARILTGDTSNPWADATLSYVVNASNVGDLDIDNPAFPKGYEDQFKKMWQVD